MSHMHRHRRLCGRYLITLGALALLGLSGYEIWIRLEDFWAWTAGIRHLSAVQGTSFVQNLAIIFEAPEMRQLGYKMLFLILSMVFALICLIRRSRAKGAWLIMLLDAALVGTGFYLGLYSPKLTDWSQVLKLVPLALILVGCVANLIHRSVLIDNDERRHEAKDAFERRQGDGHEHHHHHEHHHEPENGEMRDAG